MSTEQQKMNTDLRERYLRALAALGGKQVSVEMHERTTVSGQVAAVKSDGSHVHISQLATPIGVHPAAVLRSSDIVRLSVDWDELGLPKLDGNLANDS